MFKLYIALVVLCFVGTCVGQTFKYSHGWTNGKRGLNAHRDDISEIFGNQQNNDRRLERCLIQLEQLLNNPLQLRGGVQTLTPINNGNHHQTNELYEDLSAADANEYGKH